MKKWFENLQISKKLSTSFLCVVLLSVIIGVVGIVSIYRIDTNDTKLYEEDTLGLNYAGEAAVQFMQVRYSSIRRQNTKDPAAIKELVETINNNIIQIDTSLHNFDLAVKDPLLLALTAEMRGDWDEYKANVTKENEAALQGQTVAFSQSMDDLANELRDDFLSLFDKVSEEAEVTAEGNTVSARIAIVIMVAVIIFSAALALLFSQYISFIISKPIQMLSTVSGMLAVGDVNIDNVIDEKDWLLKHRKDEVGVLALSFNHLIASTKEQVHQTQIVAEGDLTTAITVRGENDLLGHSLAELVRKFHTLASSISATSEQVNIGAEQVSDGAQALSSGTTEQAATIEELTASVTSVARQSELNAVSVQKASEYVKQAGEGVEASNVHMQKLNNAMKEISASSEQISSITKVIEDIAFQTNILALNAAIEAARAGSAGKGFAVVADEVRSLAAKSSEAAKQTSDLIDKSVATVAGGELLAAETSKLLSTVSEKAELVQQSIEDIERASAQQAEAIGEINQGLSQVSSVVQTNAATAEESSAASEELATQAQALQHEVKKFKLHDDNNTHSIFENPELPIKSRSDETHFSLVGAAGLEKY
ncbi:methyl-accepting chemotaxis protein [Oscillospiraceae bacterium MB08-C2-2]|nr:methyl-accepting chemotaxis protein [Oscillospiraceae bacterium MB08-C2-2]